MTPRDSETPHPRGRKRSARVGNLIAEKIFSGGLVQGHRLPTEKEMIEEYDVGRTTVREALRLLESRDLVTVKAGIGGGPIAKMPQLESLGQTMKLFFQINGATISDVIDVRLMLEPIVARAAADTVTDHQIEIMQGALDRILENPHDHDAFQLNNALFQRTIYDAVGNPALKLVMETLWLLVRDAEPSEHPLATRMDAAELQSDLLDAMRSRDPDAAEAAMQVFVERSARYYRRYLADVISQPVKWEL